MAITRDDFQNIPSNGQIPDDMLPASAFAVSYFFIYTGTPSLDTFNHTFTGTIRLFEKDASGNFKYWIEIQETYNLFVFPLAPGLVLYTWNWVPSAEKIDGRIGPPNEDGTHDGPKMRTLGLGTFGVDPPEGSGTTNFEVIVSSRFYSGVFTEPLAHGDTLTIGFHNLSAGFVIKQASLQLATERAAAGLDTVFDRAGALLFASAGGGAGFVRSGRSWPGHRFADVGRAVPGELPSLVEMPDGREIMATRQKNGEYVEFVSHTSEWSWERVLYPDREKGTGRVPLTLWGESADMPLLAAVGNTRITIAVQEGALLARRVTDDAVGEAAHVLDADPTQSYSISADASGTFWISDLTGLPVAVSRNDGMTWQPLPTPAGAAAEASQ